MDIEIYMKQKYQNVDYGRRMETVKAHHLLTRKKEVKTLVKQKKRFWADGTNAMMTHGFVHGKRKQYV